MLRLSKFTAFLSLGLLVSACSESDAPLGLEGSQDLIPQETPGEGMVSQETIVDLVVDLGESTSPDGFSILLAAVLASGPDIPALLDGNGQYTVFAPNNQAFETFLEENGLTAEAVLGNPELLQQVLSYHVTRGRLMSNAVVRKRQIRMLDGNFVQVNGTELNGEINIIGVDNEVRNGIVHVIDGVLIPPMD